MEHGLTLQRLLQDGFAAHRNGRVDEAETVYRAILDQEPQHFDARHLLGVALRAKGRLAEAAFEISLALTIDPANADAYNNLANIHIDMGDDVSARSKSWRAVQIRPAFFQALLSTAQLALRAEDKPSALGYFERAAAAAPSLAWHFNCRGQALRAEGDSANAAEHFAKAVTADPTLPDLHEKWGEALEASARLPEALAAYREGARRAAPTAPSNLESIGRVLRRLFRLEESVTMLKSALCLDPAARGVTLHLAAAAFDLRRLDEARRWFSIAHALEPADEVACLGLFNTALYACDWNGWQSLQEEALSRMRMGKSGFQPFCMLATSDNPADQLLAARAHSAHLYGKHPEPLWQPETEYRHDRLRVGYLSADFHTHATAYLIAELIEVHDRQKFEIIAFSYGPDDASPMRRRLVEAFDQFHDVHFKTDQQAAELIRQAEIDILIDLKGYTQHVRPHIVAFRPAPVQVNYLGFPGTLGSPFHDYVIADEVVIPPEDDEWYTEKVIRLPGTYQVNDGRRSLGETPPTRQEAGLPEGAFVFCCFNNNWKIGPAVFSVWMRLLRQVPDSVLWLIRDNEAAVSHLNAAAAQHGIDPARLVFTSRIPLQDHLARHRLADLFLDTLPYGAHTTASDAIFAGLPVLTCRGNTFAGRVAASLLTALGVPELITGNLEDYAAAALALATTPSRLHEIREKLITAPGRRRLFDATAFVSKYEEALLSLR